MIMADGKKVLIVDDEKPLAHALQLKLNSEGFQTSTAGNGVEAVELLTKEHFDLVLLDLVMPQKDGFAVLEELKAKNVTTPVIVTSNLSQTEDFEKAKKLGAKGYFIKSDTPLAEIVAKVKAMLT